MPRIVEGSLTLSKPCNTCGTQLNAALPISGEAGATVMANLTMDCPMTGCGGTATVNGSVMLR